MTTKKSAPAKKPAAKQPEPDAGNKPPVQNETHLPGNATTSETVGGTTKPEDRQRAEAANQAHDKQEGHPNQKMPADAKGKGKASKGKTVTIAGKGTIPVYGAGGEMRRLTRGEKVTVDEGELDYLDRDGIPYS